MLASEKKSKKSIEEVVLERHRVGAVFHLKAASQCEKAADGSLWLMALPTSLLSALTQLEPTTSWDLFVRSRLDRPGPETHSLRERAGDNNSLESRAVDPGQKVNAEGA